MCQRRRSAAHLHRCVCPRRCRGLTEGVTARAVRLRLWSSGVPPARRQQGRVESRHALAALRVPGYGRVSSLRDDECGDGDDVAVMMLCRRVGNALFSVTPLTRSVSGECVGVWRMSMPMRFGDALLRERRRRESRMRSAGRTRFQLTPDSASGDRVEREICTARRCR